MRLKFWIKNSAEVILGILFIAALALLLNYNSENFANILGEELFFLSYNNVFLGTTFHGVMIANLYNLHLSMALSFGSTRKETLIGMQCYRLLPVITLAILGFAFSIFAGKDNVIPPMHFAFLTSGISLIFESVCVFTGILYARYGNKAIFFIIVILIGEFGGLVFIMFMFATNPMVFSDNGIVWILFTAGLLAHGLSIIPEYKLVHKYTVKF